MLETFDKQQLLLPLVTDDTVLISTADIGGDVVFGICVKGNKVYLVPLKSDALYLPDDVS